MDPWLVYELPLWTRSIFLFLLPLAIYLAPRAGKFCAVIGYPKGQDGAILRRVPQEKSPCKPYNKSFIDQVCLVKVTEYWPRSFFAKKNLASWPNKRGQITHV